jgi:peptidoglycan/LPS O-acetylase OafA/YrhL
MPATLGSALAQRGNALNFVRLFLASAVVLGHTAPLGGFAENPLSDIRTLAVNGFFVLSGFLIAGSRMRLGLIRFLWHRALRIMPGFWMSLVVVALVVAPITAALSGEAWQLSSALTWITGNGLLVPHQEGIANTLQHVPVVGVWNGSLWTLQFEFLAYAAAGVLLTSRLVRSHLTVVLPLLTFLSATAMVLAAGPLPVASYFWFNALRLGTSFSAGMTLWAFRDSLPRTARLTVVCASATCFLYFLTPALMYALAPLPLGYLLLALGGSRRVRLGSTNDLSYGAYIYAFPVQQVLVLLGGHRLGYAGMFVAALALTAPLAWLSWRLVERPSLRLKHLGLGRSRTAALAFKAPATDPEITLLRAF